MHRQLEDVRVLAQPQQRKAQERADDEVEFTARLVREQVTDPSLLPGFVQVTQVYYEQGRLKRGVNDLNGLPVDGEESGAQRLVPPHDLVEASSQRVNLDAAFEAQRRVQIVDLPARAQLLGKPQSLL
jgi:hypothetical protein